MYSIIIFKTLKCSVLQEQPSLSACFFTTSESQLGISCLFFSKEPVTNSLLTPVVSVTFLCRYFLFRCLLNLLGCTLSGCESALLMLLHIH